MDVRNITGPVGQTSAPPETDQAPPPEPHDSHGMGDPPRSGARSGARNTNGSSRGRRRPQSRHIPRRSDILASLKRLPQLVAIGAITATQCNAICGVLKLLLQTIDGGAAPPPPLGGLHATSLQAAVAANPDLLHLLAPLLSDEELNELVGAEDDGDGP